MWIFTVHGAYSVVQHTKETVTVRSRFIEHLQALKKHFPNDLAHYQIKITPERDYPVRMVIPQILWSRIVQVLAGEIDYPNFKGRVARVSPSNAIGAAYKDWLHHTWLAGVEAEKIEVDLRSGPRKARNVR